MWSAVKSCSMIREKTNDAEDEDDDGEGEEEE